MAYFDTIIIGGGAAGILAAISAKRSRPESRVAILDRTFALGRKILVSGAGRCNLTNLNLGLPGWRKYYQSDTPELPDRVFKQFGYQDIIGFFEDLGILTYAEAKNNYGKIFPVTDSARNVVSLLKDELQRVGVEIYLEHEVRGITASKQGFELEVRAGAKRTLFQSSYLILAAGGKTYPTLGSNGSGYTLAQSFGHAILEPVPVAGPLLCKDLLCQELQGVRLNASAELIINSKVIKTVQDELIFTRYGLSGSLIFNLSAEVSLLLNRTDMKNRDPRITVKLNFIPGMSALKLKKYLTALWQKRPGQSIELSLYGVVGSKLAHSLGKRAAGNPERLAADLSDKERRVLLAALQSTSLSITGTKGWEESEFTAGGVRTAELNPETLESLLVPNLFLCGELVNVVGAVGGYNLSWAWASGMIAGRLGKIARTLTAEYN